MAKKDAVARQQVPAQVSADWARSTANTGPHWPGQSGRLEFNWVETRRHGAEVIRRCNDAERRREHLIEENRHTIQNAEDNLSAIVQDLLMPLERFAATVTELFSEISTPPDRSQEREQFVELEQDNRVLQDQIQTLLRELVFYIAELKAWLWRGDRVMPDFQAY
jgi:hypothetical protein